eukprot:CAMPEP_0113937218 /NCGR_PEP_ID=MMETSP1339-20121228/3886_1 /TAXON_ID=94617 /ORGANISM="Fibrocapsa japonica" /LENGTH=115 /DNA_ID=CAMNT_0000939903 /DNA_START=104 /DNA_END=451 /DNA_ORIENTATION=+ /assembly_acc=CAM_ASM_000762
MLLSMNGALLGSSVLEGSPPISTKVVSAILSNIWCGYSQAGVDQDAPQAVLASGGRLGGLVFELEQGWAAMGPAGEGYLVCLVAQEGVAPASLRQRARMVGKQIGDQLEQLELAM